MNASSSLLIFAAAFILATMGSCSRPESTEDVTRKVSSERYARPYAEQWHDVVVDCNANVSVRPTVDGVEVTLSFANSTSVELAFLPSFLVLEVTPEMPVWYPHSIARGVMELVIDSVPPEPFIQHATSMFDVTRHPIQFILLARNSTTTVVYNIPYDERLTKEKLAGLRVYRGSFNIPVWMVNDTLRGDLIRQGMIPMLRSNHYTVSVRDGAKVVTEMANQGKILSQEEAELLFVCWSQAPCLRLKHVTIDSVLR